MWPFKKRETEEPDERPVSEGAKAIATSMAKEPARWHIHERDEKFLVHDSGIIVHAFDGVVGSPWYDEPAKNQGFLADAIDKWVAARLALPAPEPVKDAN